MLLLMTHPQRFWFHWSRTQGSALKASQMILTYGQGGKLDTFLLLHFGGCRAYTVIPKLLTASFILILSRPEGQIGLRDENLRLPLAYKLGSFSWQPGGADQKTNLSRRNQQGLTFTSLCWPGQTQLHSFIHETNIY